MNDDREKIVRDYLDPWLDAVLRDGADVSKIEFGLGTDNRGDLLSVIDDLAKCADMLDRVWGSPDSTAVAGTATIHDLDDTDVGEDRASFGRFRISGELGRGGEGVVYLAYDPELNRKIALKVPHPALLADRKREQRFIIQAQAAARLSHPHLVTVHDTGVIDDHLFIASEFCDGPTLRSWLTGKASEVSPTVAAKIVRDVAEGVYHAHSRGIIHRDLKPSNIFLTRKAPQEVESAEFPYQVKVGDFGLARLTDVDSDLTHSHAVLGTPHYMAPEQAAGNVEQLSAASDIFSLGAILYELLTGSLPFAGSHRGETLQLVQYAEQPSIRAARSAVPRDLESICCMCLRKEPEKRYSSAAVLRDDLDRFLAGDPVSARPISLLERTAKWVRRRPVAALLVFCVVLFAATAFSGVIVHYQRLSALNMQMAALNTELEQANDAATQAKSNAEERAFELFQSVYVADMGDAFAAWQSRDLHQTRILLEKYLPQAGVPDVRGFEWHWLWAAVQPRSTSFALTDDTPTGVQYWPDGSRVAVATEGGHVHIYAPDDWAVLKSFDSKQQYVHDIEIAPDGTSLATAGADGTVRIWDSQSFSQIHTITAMDGAPVRCVRYARDCSRIAVSGDDRFVTIWDVASGELSQTVRIEQPQFSVVAWSPSGKYLATAEQHAVRVWETESGNLWRRLDLDASEVTALEFVRGQLRLLATSQEGSILLWDVATSTVLQHRVTLDPILSVSVSDDSDWFATGDRRGGIRSWKLDSTATSFDEASFWSAHQLGSRVRDSAFEPSSSRFVTVASDGRVKQWSSPLKPVTRVLRPVPDGLVLADFASIPAGDQLITAGTESIRIWNPGTGIELSSIPSERGGWTAIAVTRSGELLACGNSEGVVEFWNLGTMELVSEFQIDASGSIDDLAFSQDGALLSVTFDSSIRNDCLHIYEVETARRREFIPRGHYDLAVFSPTEPILALARVGEIELWNVREQKLITTLQRHTAAIHHLTFSADGSLLVSGGKDRLAVVWDVSSARVKNVLSRHTAEVNSAVLTPDGQTLITGDTQGGLSFWHLPSGKKLFERRDPAHEYGAAAITSQGNQLAIQNRNELVILDSNQRDLSSLNSASHRATPESTNALRRQRRRYYQSQMRLANAASEQADFTKMRELLSEFVPVSDEFDVRTLGWHLLASCSSPLDPLVVPVRSAKWHQAVMFSDDGDWLVVTGKDSTLWIVDAATLSVRHEIKTNQKELRFLDVSSDSQWVAVAGRDASIAIYSMETGREIQRFETPSDTLRVGISPDGSLLAACFARPELVIMGADDGQIVKRLKSDSRFSSLKFTADGRSLVTCQRNGRIAVWDIETMSIQHALYEPNKAVSHGVVADSRDGNVLAVSIGNEVRLWDVQTWEPLAEATTPAPIDALALSSDGRQLLTGDLKSEIRQYRYAPSKLGDANTLRLVDSWVGHRPDIGWVESLAFSPKNHRIVSSANDGVVKIWHDPGYVSRRVLSLGQTGSDRDGVPVELQAIPNSDRVVFMDGPSIIVTGLDSGTEVARYESKQSGWTALAVGSVGNYLAATTSESEVVLLTLPALEVVGRWSIEHADRVRSVEISESAALIAAVIETESEFALQVYNFQGSVIDSAHGLTCYAARFSPTGEQVALATNGVIQLRSTTDFSIQHRLPQRHPYIQTMAYSADGKLLASLCQGEERIHVWRAESGEAAVPAIPIRRGPIRQLLFTPRGDSIVALAQEDMVTLWDLSTGEHWFERHLLRAGGYLHQIQLSGNAEHFVGLQSGNQALVIDLKN